MDFNLLALVAQATLQTLYMAAAAGLLGLALGFPLGAFLATSGRGELFEAPRLNRLLASLAAAANSIPFIILAVATIPLTRALAGTSIGATAAVVPLTIAAAPLFAKVVEGAIRDVDPGLIEASRAMGATSQQIVFKVLLREAAPAMRLGFALSGGSLLGNAAIAGAVGGGGLGDLGIRFGYQSFTPEVMAAIVVICVAILQAVHVMSERLARRDCRTVRAAR